ncbi:hypothetical protein OHT93_34450 [Streptomyces sp. NBC_00191]|uniref:hypothetical protein n=1 Tax=Streptomyces sp. NBC_00191 TaxID=2975674 RepID=UPI00324E1A90
MTARRGTGRAALSALILLTVLGGVAGCGRGGDDKGGGASDGSATTSPSDLPEMRKLVDAAESAAAAAESAAGEDD